MEKSVDKTVSTKVFIFTLSLILSSSITFNKNCDVFKGKWVPYPQGPYYSNETCRLIVDQHNCIKFGRPDTEFMKWRWKPDDCELPRFDAAQFLEFVRGNSMAFVRDSVARNQMESLLCLLAHEAYPEAISHNSKRWFYADYNFTL
ncbi:protein trichome birefringence-like 20 [Hibiscus syriacus]|uniref:protein trichome birefringence-like 20 n=1 Tax=Hibiscus syriacus TaxID=106335 RepID=UPI001924733E|nr:protein trichome birefringence-like 20 [Hibiscus syriacus]